MSPNFSVLLISFMILFFLLSIFIIVYLNSLSLSWVKLMASQMSFTTELYQAFRGLLPILHKLFQKNGRGWYPFPSHFMRLILSWYLKRTKISQENYRSISFINMATKVFNKMPANWIQQYRKESYAMASGIYLTDIRLAQHLKIN